MANNATEAEAGLAAAPWTDEEIEDLLADAITDSLDIDWTSRDGAKAILRELSKNGLRHVCICALGSTR